MAHFAELDGNNTVLRVIVLNNEVIGNAPGVEGEQVGTDFLNQLFGYTGLWKQTSYNASFRGAFAYPGGTYDPTTDTFSARPKAIP